MSRTNRIVLKFGGSVLHSSADFDRICGEIQRFVSHGYQVVAVVSAYYGVTEKLIKKAGEQALNSNSIAYAELIAGGEFQSASDLVSHLLKSGLNASYQTPADFDFLAMGARDGAKPAAINADKISAALLQNQVLVVPGFSAIDEQGNCILLGRGGSDISAVFIAQALGLKSVRLLKDVDGLYDVDPNKFDQAQRLPYVDYKTACRIGGELIQTEAIEFAAVKQICIDVAGIGENTGSRIGPESITEQAGVAAELPMQEIRIGLI